MEYGYQFIDFMDNCREKYQMESREYILNRMADFLQRFEWSSMDLCETPICPVCHGEQPEPGHEDDPNAGHKENCELVELLTLVALEGPHQARYLGNPFVDRPAGKIDCPQCSRPFRLNWREHPGEPQTIVVRLKPDGSDVHDILICCPHCTYEEPVSPAR